MLLLIKSRRLAIVFILGVILLNYPILSLFNVPRFFFGIPVLILYLFTIWALLILITIIISVVNIKPPSPPAQS
jgi:hypothetical protein